MISSWFSSKVLTEEEKRAAEEDLRQRLLPEHITSTELQRWLRAEKYSVDKAGKRLQHHLHWRADYLPQGCVLEEEIRTELDQKKVFLQGCDELGRPVSVVVVNKHLPHCPAETKRLIVYCFEASIALSDAQRNPLGLSTGIFDLRNIRLENLDAGALRGVFSVLQDHYPERLGVLVMFGAPAVFHGLWMAVLPFIAEETRAKVKFVSEGDMAEALSFIPPDVLPETFGGKALLLPVDEAVRKFGLARAPQCSGPAKAPVDDDPEQAPVDNLPDRNGDVAART
ncbi:hypothetical protein WJX81_004320 [Elliptochloris bilobata]|uniref:CRAL-TRIO domain-containing protein n=1 Tax=Elliptochloris bilobata TaxID=381761 RepID=A0AAW1RF66_9CHLO